MSAQALAGSLAKTEKGLIYGMEHHAFSDSQIARIMDYSDHICEMAKEVDEYRADILKFGRDLAIESQKAGRTGLPKDGKS